LRLQLLTRAGHSFGGWALEKCPRLGVNGSMQEIVAGGVTDIEMDGGIEVCDFDEIGLAKVTALFGWAALATRQQKRSRNR
jgi:hypothetical protein